MPPIDAESKDVESIIDQNVAQNKVMIFSKTTCPFCRKVKDLFTSLKIEYKALELNELENGASIQNALVAKTGQKTVPNVFINGKHIGGCDDTLNLQKENKLLQLVNPSTEKYDYDLIVIGGGSGGLAAAKEASLLGAKVACLDFVKPSPQGTSWGLGGTCVNVGCIPKKLMHQAALLGHAIEDAKHYGWEVEKQAVKHNWGTMVEAIQNYIGSLNWNYRVQLREKNVKYINSYAEFIGPHKIKATNRRGKVEELSAAHFILATGGRPRYPDIPGCKEYCITSDDLFSMRCPPGKSLCIGASYVSLECAGFLASLGFDTTVMVRSILLRGFDQQMSEKIGEYMANHGIKFLRPCVPTKIEKLEDRTDSSPGLYRVYGKKSGGAEEVIGDYNTVMMAVGRDPCTSALGLDAAGVQTNPKNGYIDVNEREETNISHIHAIGDILEGKPELTPMAIQAGRLLARRLYGGSSVLCDYINVPTTVFTPLEYGSIGYAEEDAIAKFGEDNLEVYHTNFWPLEWTIAERENNVCYAKLICDKTRNERVVGFHVVGPNAGEITQGFTVGMKLGATKEDFDMSVGIHPTCAEVFTSLEVTKSSGADVGQAGC